MKNDCPLKLENAIIKSKSLNKIAWSLLAFSFTAIILLIYNNYPITLSGGVPSVLQIPFEFWIICVILFTVWSFIFLNTNNAKLLLYGVVIYSFILFCTNLMFVSPYEQTDRISAYISILSNSNHIDQYEISLDNYFQWPIFFLMTKIFLEIGGLSINQVLQIGFFSINLILPIILLYMFNYEKSGNVQCKIIPIIVYILLSYTFIVNQYAPQALALLYLFILYAIYYKYLISRNNKQIILLSLMILIYAVLVLTHPFLFLFFIIPIVIDLLYQYLWKNRSNHINEKKAVRISGKTAILMVVIYFAGFLYRFSSIQYKISELVDQFGTTDGASWSIISKLYNLNNGIPTVPSYYPLLESYHYLLSNALKILLLLFIIIFLYTVFRSSESRNLITSLDKSILFSSIGLYIIGLFSIFLGERGIQVAISSIVKPFVNSYSKGSVLFRTLIIVLLICTPILLVSTSLTNISRSGESFIEDEEMNAAGYFADNAIPAQSNVLLAESIYPVSSSSIGFHRYKSLPLIDEYEIFKDMDFIIKTPKFVLQAQSYGYYYMIENNSEDFGCIYSNGFSSIRYQR